MMIAKTPAVRIEYIDDYGPLGIREYPASRYPRTYDTYELGRIGAITLPHTMTRDEWDFIFTWLEITRDAGRVIE